ncbi:MAG: hypothetical protein ACI4MJ_08490 [Aristaeellaceae bacterium]
MKTDVITVTSSGRQIETALHQVEKVAAYKGLSPKGALHLRLLAEEMMGMMRAITGEKEGQFWIEDEDGVYQLHLLVNSRMYMEKRDQLLAVSSSGKNEAAKGLMGRLLEFFDQGADAPSMPMFHASMMGDVTGATLDWEWSMMSYQNELNQWRDKDDNARAMWDELEKSVVTHVADDIKVSIRGQRAEMIVIKKLQ